MFGCLAFYRDGLLTLVLTGEGDAPWNGVLVATDRERHAALTREFPELVSHAVLGKWLYLPATSPAFERVAERLVGLVASRDARVGVAPKPKRAHGVKSRGPLKRQKSR